MRPLADWSVAARHEILGVLTDIDDTLTSQGRLPPVAYEALARLRAAGLLVVPITGRPAGWCDHIARMWPVDGVVGENGAFWFRHDEGARRLIKRFVQPEDERRRNRARLRALAARILAEIPGTALASDQGYRESDLAIDYAEDVAPLDDAAVARIVAMFEAEGATAKVSSIHVNGWFGSYDKLAMSLDLLQNAFGIAPETARARFVFTGDSPNDSPMFAAFANAIGVANVRRFAARMPALPAFVTPGEGGEGFAEMANALLAARAQ